MVSSYGLYLAFIALVIVERIGELLLSRRNATLAFARGAVEVGQGHFKVMTLFHTAFLVACVLEPWLLQRPFTPSLGFPALVLAILAQGLRYWAIATLGNRWNTRVIVLPSIEPVITGPYRLIKHPNYVAVVIEMFAIPLIHSAWLTAIVFTLGNALLLMVRIRVEEEALGPKWAQAFVGKSRFVPGANTRG